MNKDIISLFRSRDKAITARNRDAFLSTQAGELPNCSYEGYVSVGRLETKILAVHSDQMNTIHKIAFVEERYYPKNKPSYSSFVLYFLIDTKEGWKIYRLSY